MFNIHTELSISKICKLRQMAEEESKSKDSSLKKEDNLKDYLEDNSDEQIKKAENYLKKINNQLSDRLTRIDKIKKIP